MKSYKLIVSEPWNFNTLRGGNELIGHVIKHIDSENLLFEANEQATFNAITSRYWILSARYEKQYFDVEPYQGSVNGELLSELPSDASDILEIKKNAVFAIIGSIQPI